MKQHINSEDGECNQKRMAIRRCAIQPATIISLLALLIAMTTAVFVLYWFWSQPQTQTQPQPQPQPQPHPQPQTSPTIVFCEECEYLLKEMKRIEAKMEKLSKFAKKVIDKLVSLGLFQVKDRKKRQAEGQNPDDQAEDDLSELSLTGLSFLRGPPGFPGRDGRDGSQGSAGVPGPAGPPGRKGDKGDQGERGITGQSGLNGRDGQQGAYGPRGEKGDKGNSGLQGAKGDTGGVGLPGQKGERGSKGDAGALGAPGSQGLPGANNNSTMSSTNITGEIDLLKERLNLISIEGSKVVKCPSWTRGGNLSQTVIGDTCYVLVDQRKTWTEAKSYCEQKGFHLVTYESSRKQGFVENWLLHTLGRTTSDDVWTGGFRKAGRPRTEWFWSKGSQELAIRDYTDWSSGEPQSHEYCLVNDHLKWYGRSCTDRYDFVCEGKASVEIVPATKGGAVYTHWGRDTCSNSSTTIYSGLAAGAKYDTPGGGVNYQCLPPNPDLDRYNVNANDVSWMRSVEYESQSYGLFAGNIDNKHAVCARCYTRNRPGIMMIPAKTSCPEDWTKEYDGFLMASGEGEAHASTYECVDSNPQYQLLTPADLGGRFWFVNIDCDGNGGSVGRCNQYRHGRQLTCVVCSK